MDNNTIITMISTLGFPIVMCVAMGFIIYKFFEYFKDLLKDLMKSIADMQKVLEHNTVVMEKIMTILDAEKDDMK